MADRAQEFGSQTAEVDFEALKAPLRKLVQALERIAETECPIGPVTRYESC